MYPAADLSALFGSRVDCIRRKNSAIRPSFIFMLPKRHEATRAMRGLPRYSPASEAACLKVNSPATNVDPARVLGWFTNRGGVGIVDGSSTDTHTTGVSGYWARLRRAVGGVD